MHHCTLNMSNRVGGRGARKLLPVVSRIDIGWSLTPELTFVGVGVCPKRCWYRESAVRTAATLPGLVVPTASSGIVKGKEGWILFEM